MLAGELLARCYNNIIDIMILYDVSCARRDNVCIIMCAKRYSRVGSFAARGVLISCCSVMAYLFSPRSSGIFISQLTRKQIQLQSYVAIRITRFIIVFSDILRKSRIIDNTRNLDIFASSW